MTGQVVPDEMMIVMAPRNDDVYNITTLSVCTPKYAVIASLTPVS